MIPLSRFLAATAVLGLAACAAEPYRVASPGVAAAPQNVQQGVGYSPEDRYVNQRGGSSAPMQGGRITSVQQEGGGNTTVYREGIGTGIRNPRIRSLQQEGGGNVDIQRQGVGAPGTR